MDQFKELFYSKAKKLRDELKALGKEHGSVVVDQVTVSQVLGGMRGIKGMVCETSALDPEEGIRFRGYTIPELKEILPTFENDKEPLPEGLFWLMLTGDVPTSEQVKWLSDEWERRRNVPAHTYALLESLPLNTHPMTQFSAAILSMQTESVFSKAYAAGISKNDHWDPTYEDSMNLIANLPSVAAYIYRRVYHNGQHIKPNDNLDWAGSFAHMLGMNAPDFRSLMRLYLTIHADHEGGNASAHTVHLVGSTLSDAYYSFAAGMTSLAGPLHGLANQEVIRWIFDLTEQIGTIKPTKEQLKKYVKETLASGKVIPGYGHAVLRKPDPRFIAQKEFAEEYIKDSDYVQIVWDLFEVVPPILESLGKVKNPWPNVDAHSGAILVHYGLKEFTFYTVLFGVSRALGVLSSLCWSRALGFALERPKSVTSDWIKDYIKNKN